MTVKSWSTKLYLGITSGALVMWVFGVSGQTILAFAAVGLMVAMHVGGHPGGSHGGRADHHDADVQAGHSGRASSASSTGARPTDTDTRSGRRGGCH